MDSAAMHRMGRIGVSLGLLLGFASPAWAADDAAEAASATTDASREQILQTIETTRQTDPALAEEMERQLGLMDSGDLKLSLPEGESDRTTLGGPEALGAPGLIGPPGEDDQSGGDPRFQAVQSDPRMQAVREQFEAGNLTEGQAREQVFEVLRDYGIEPAGGREWEHGQGSQDGEGKTQEGFERAWEHMSPEAHEQMERLYEQGGERSEGERQTFERMFESIERQYESPEHEATTGTREYEAPTHEVGSTTREVESVTREYEATTRDYETPARESQTTTHEYEAPTREYQMPEPPREYEAPPQH